MREQKTAVALVAKAPVPGRVKTRFCPPCTPLEAAAFARAFLLDSVATVTGDEFVAAWCSHHGDADVLRALLPPEVQLLPQRDELFADRLANAADDLFALGYEHVVLLAADAPTVSREYLHTAIAALHDHDVVLGPADDGGYTLIAISAPERRLFVGIEMSTERVLRETVERADDLGLRTLLLDARYDLDSIDALLVAHGAGELSHAHHTLALLSASVWAQAANQ